MSDNSNYAAVQYGVHSVPAAAVFAGLYSILFVWFVRQSFKRPCPIFFTLTFFCAGKFPIVTPYPKLNIRA